MTRRTEKELKNVVIAPLESTVKGKGMTTQQMTVQLDFSALVKLTASLQMMVSWE